jgi:hypothetical protein
MVHDGLYSTILESSRPAWVVELDHPIVGWVFYLDHRSFLQEYK